MMTEEPVRGAIWYTLSHYCYNDAIFLSERLHAEVDSVDTAHLLATCYFRSGRVRQARHLLGKYRGIGSGPCDLLYARCCLELKDHQAGLLALNGLLCLEGGSEEDIVARFGPDAGMAFWLLGELNRQLHQWKEAVKYFGLCLMHNPFLWSAFQALCELGDKPSPDVYFTVADYPDFLQSHSHSSVLSIAQSVPPSKPSKMDPPGKKPAEPSAFTPVEGSTFEPVKGPKPYLVTPDLFGNVGRAVASSTPLPRTLPFTAPTAAPPNNPLTPEDQGMSARGGEGEGGGGRSGKVALRHLRLQLQYSSGPSGSVELRRRGASVTPYTPTFGVLPLQMPDPMSSSLPPPPNQVLDFSTVTPSPTPLSPDYLQLLQSAPRSQKHRRPPQRGAIIASNPKLQFDSPSDMLESSSKLDDHPSTSTDETKSTNQNIASQSHDQPTPSMDAMPTMAPPATSVGLRRSTRLSEAGKSLSSMSPSQRRAPSCLATHSSRAKSRMKGSLAHRGGDATSRKVSHVTFSTPGRNCPDQKPEPLTSHPFTPSHLLISSHQSVNVCEEKEGEKGMRREGGGGDVREEVGGEGMREEVGGEGANLKLAAMASIGNLMDLLVELGTAYRDLCEYNLVSAIRRFRSLPPHHHHTAWVLSQLASCYFTGERFKEASKLYADVHQMDPHRQEGMDLYSSALWHLQREVDLSVLAEELQNSDRCRPEGLCAMASVLNLQKDHPGALRLLQRAIQVSPQFSYAHILLGHEFWLVKDYDRAIESFQSAVTINPRLYNAWYGMAHVCYTQEKYRSAGVYAAKAFSLNPNSSVACTQLALAQFRQNQLELSLQTLDRAISVNRTNPIPIFHRAKVLEAMGRLEDALQQLEKLSTSWPKEPNLYISKGKILNKLGRSHEAILQFSWALDFSRSGANSRVREEIDRAYHSHNTSLIEQESDFVPHMDSDGEREGEGEGEAESMDSMLM